MKKSAFCLAVLTAFVLLAGCSVQYHAVLYDDANAWIRPEFAAENPTRGAYYEDGSKAAETEPAARTFLIESEEACREILVADLPELEVDFDQHMLVIYTFTTIYHRDNWLTEVREEDGVLRIVYQMEKKYGIGDASRPWQRWFVIRLDRVSVRTAIIAEKS